MLPFVCLGFGCGVAAPHPRPHPRQCRSRPHYFKFWWATFAKIFVNRSWATSNMIFPAMLIRAREYFIKMVRGVLGLFWSIWNPESASTHHSIFSYHRISLFGTPESNAESEPDILTYFLSYHHPISPNWAAFRFGRKWSSGSGSSCPIVYWSFPTTVFRHFCC